MTTINIYDLSILGLDLFQDSETFLNELTEDELNYISGGFLDDVFDVLQLAIIPQENQANINGQTINAFTQNNFNTAP
ncbi:hypothetical protein NIES37_50780 [Tolypothrix tenuis PCC 7101]|uniref:Uncharacterized protein n=1 Tax=Tolypothrix tenuis PCC 7101 TaxID=231146 RepID=A0A1Z4N5S8_9CYAN|nr:hypothetical protein [Aulosira sp. FACHB-113]BAZ01080.1 hypothetical protein NIES37_50780 [Tolypothrix tenuis PCC 7101]BAZ74998.1 hypothetical protein NIES50_35780 [Aulosira laxa NIES-50]